MLDCNLGCLSHRPLSRREPGGDHVDRNVDRNRRRVGQRFRQAADNRTMLHTLRRVADVGPSSLVLQTRRVLKENAFRRGLIFSAAHVLSIRYTCVPSCGLSKSLN
jgi:hypothetical protein